MQKVHFPHLSICVNRHIHDLAECKAVDPCLGALQTSHQRWVHVAVPRTSPFPSQRVTSAHGIFIAEWKRICLQLKDITVKESMEQ